MPCWRRVANSLKDRIEFVGLWSTAFFLGLKVGWDEKGAKRRPGRAEKHGVQGLLTLQASSRTLLTFRDGSVFFRQQQRQGQLLLHKSKIIPFPPFPSWRPPRANTAGFSVSCASGQQGAHNRLSREAPSSRENMRYYVGPRIWSFSHHSQAAFVSCFVSFLISLC